MKNIVTIGGGTGSFVLLSGLKNYPLNISAIVSMADDGGSTGVLRDELGVLPPGDVRQCLVALSNSSETMRELMNYKFDNGSFNGHNFGNLLLSALAKIKGDFIKGTFEVAKILNVRGEVIPVSRGDMRIIINLNNGKVLRGEKFLDYNEDIHRFGLKKVRLEKKVKASEEALDRIRKADFIIIGPGDHFGSIIPNLLVSGIPAAIRKSKAKVIYNCNLTNKKGQTIGYDLDRYASDINRYLGAERIDLVTFNNIAPGEYLTEKYEKLEGKNSMVLLSKKSKERSYRIVRADLLQKTQAKISDQELYSRKHSFIRHDSQKLGKLLNIIFELGDFEHIIKEII